jgi:uncharacterized protein (TIGR02145 family)
MRNFVLLFLFSYTTVLSQPADIQAKAAFLSAQDAYGNGDYPAAIDKLEHVKKLLGSTNPRVEHLLANAYLENGDVGKAEESMKMYFKLAADNDANYMSMLRMTETIREKRAEAELIEQLKKLEQIEKEAYQNALKINSSEAFASFLDTYPKSPNRLVILKAWNTLPTEDLIDSRDGNRYKTTRFGHQIWMAEDLRLETEGAKFDKKLDIMTYRSDEELSSLCPDGYRLPTTDDVMNVIVNMGYRRTIRLDGMPFGNEFVDNRNDLIDSLTAKGMSNENMYNVIAANQKSFGSSARSPIVNTLTKVGVWQEISSTNGSGLGFKPTDRYGGLEIPVIEVAHVFLSDGYFAIVVRKALPRKGIDSPTFYLTISKTDSIPEKKYSGVKIPYACRCIKEDKQ